MVGRVLLILVIPDAVTDVQYADGVQVPTYLISHHYYTEVTP